MSKKITTFFWDCGGVLLTNGWDHVERAKVLADFKLDKAAFESRHEEPNDAWEKGKIDVYEYLNETIFYEPRPFTPDDFLSAMKQQSQILHQGSMDILAALGDAGYRNFMLNNEAAELNNHRIASFGFHKTFDAFFSSCYLGMRKPAEDIFLKGLEMSQRRPEESAFVDDRANNIATATKLGFNAIRFESPAQLKTDLKRLGVEIAAG